jgi:hypothetical protein
LNEGTKVAVKKRSYSALLTSVESTPKPPASTSGRTGVVESGEPPSGGCDPSPGGGVAASLVLAASGPSPAVPNDVHAATAPKGDKTITRRVAKREPVFGWLFRQGVRAKRIRRKVADREEPVG